MLTTLAHIPRLGRVPGKPPPPSAGCRARRWAVDTAALVLLLPWGSSGPALAEIDPHAVFTSRCGACHTVGHGDDVGPDLAGVTERHEREWLIPFIQSSQTVIQSGDPTARELYERFQQQKMPDHPYSAEDIGRILDYIEAGGPDALEPRVRPATEAGAKEIVEGRELFFGRRAFAAGGAACATCHSVGDRTKTLRGSLGGDLMGVYGRYHDRELTRALLLLDSAVMRELYRTRPLDDAEIFCIKAFLAHCEGAVDIEIPEGTATLQGSAGNLPLLGLPLAVILGLVGDGWHRRREQRRAGSV